MRNEKGFTLIEVMVVIIMIGVLAAVAIPIYSGYVFRARASEGVAMLGAMKTFALERRTSQGKWPTLDEIKTEFHSFNDLYYFNTVSIFTSGNRFAARITVSLAPDENKFGLPSDFGEPWAQLDFAITGVAKTQVGWSGGVVEEYAKHLLLCTDPLKS